MSEYVKTTWQTGDVITAEKLNNIEDGIANNSKGGGARFIDFDTLQPVADDPQAAQYEPGLTEKDFVNTYVYMRQTVAWVPTMVMASISWLQKSEANDYIRLIDAHMNGDPMEFWYYPETGHLKIHLLETETQIISEQTVHVGQGPAPLGTVSKMPKAGQRFKLIVNGDSYTGTITEGDGNLLQMNTADGNYAGMVRSDGEAMFWSKTNAKYTVSIYIYE